MDIHVFVVLFLAFIIYFFDEDGDVSIQTVGFSSVFLHKHVSIAFTGGINNHTVELIDICKQYDIAPVWLMTSEEMARANPMLMKKMTRSHVVTPILISNSTGIALEYHTLQYFCRQYNCSMDVLFYTKAWQKKVLHSVANLSTVSYTVPTGDSSQTYMSVNSKVWHFLNQNNISGVVAINQTKVAVEYLHDFFHDMARFKYKIVDPERIQYK